MPVLRVIWCRASPPLELACSPPSLLRARRNRRQGVQARRQSCGKKAPMTNLENTERFKVIVVGGGQAGLSVGYHLLQREISPLVILDANTRIGDAWRKRWDSLRLFSPAGYRGRRGMPS